MVIYLPDGTEAGTGSGGSGDIATCTSTTRPSSPTTGDYILETDTGLLRQWSGTAWDIIGSIAIAGKIYLDYTGTDSTSIYFKVDSTSGNLIVHIPSSTAIEYHVGDGA